jgi:uncharacterized protein (DUF608 family)
MSLKIKNVFTISGAQIPEIYVKNKMGVHFQGMSKTMQFPQTIFLQGAPTCSVGISPEGLYNRLNDAGRLVFLNQKAIQFASAPFIRIPAPKISIKPGAFRGGKFIMLTTKNPKVIESPDDIPVSENYYYKPISVEQTSISIAPPLTEITYKLGKVRVTRKMISPFLSGNAQTFMPICVEEHEVTNAINQVQKITLVIPRPSLVNLQEKKLRPVEQDSAFICSTPLRGHLHEDFRFTSMRGVVMGNSESLERMVIAVPEMKNIAIDTQPYFRLNSLKQDLMLNPDGSFYTKLGPKANNDYGAAVSITFTLKPKATIKIPVAIVFDFPEQWYCDGIKFERKYTKSFKNKETRAKDMAKIALDNYPEWLSRTIAIQNKIFENIQRSPSYKNDRNGALRLARLVFNEFHFPLSNAAVWVEDNKGNDTARFLECFDYPYINSSDVDWYSMIMLMLFPNIEKELCQRAIDSITQENLKERYYHFHASFVEVRKHFEDNPKEYKGKSLTHIKAATKIKGSVSHDLGAMTLGHALRNVSDYTWYNTNYWIDLFPKLALRVLRNVKHTGDIDFLKKNWKTLKFGFEYLEKLDLDKDGIPEGNPDEVKNTFDNINLFGIDSYSTNGFLACCKAMIKMADMMKDTPAKKEYKEIFEKGFAVYDKLWIDKKTNRGRMQYFATCYDPNTGKMNLDVWTNQLDGLWYLIAMGEKPFIPEERAKQTLKTIYKNNRTPMGWVTARTQNGKPVKSDQGKDVWIASNYVLAQLLDYYGLVKESKEVYKTMDKVIFKHGNSLITPESVRPTLEKEKGETKPGPHYIVAGYTRPGAIYTQLAIQFIRETQKRTGATTINSKQLNSFVDSLFIKAK